MLNEHESTYRCPGCGQPLTVGQTAQGMYWCCPACEGRLVSVAVLRKTVLCEAVNDVWQHASEGAGTPGKRCPVCRQAMCEVHITVGGVAMDVDVCRRCVMVWFDPCEYGALPPKPDLSAPPEPKLPPDAREAVALAQVDAIGWRPDIPVAAWRLVIEIFGCLIDDTIFR